MSSTGGILAETTTAMTRYRIGTILASLAIAFVWSAPLLLGNYINHGVDIVSHINWTKQFHDLLANGVYFPQWLWDENGGLGESLFLRNPPAFYYLSSLGAVLTNDIWLGIKLALFLIFFFVSYFSILFLDKHFSGNFVYLAALVVTGSPIIILTLYYYTGLATFASFAPMAAVFYFSGKQLESETVCFGLVFAVFLLVLTHPLTAYIGIGAIASAMVVSAVFWKRLELRILSSWVLSVALGMGLSSFYLVAALSHFSDFFVTMPHVAADVDWRRGFIFPFVSVAPGIKIYWPLFQWYLPTLYLACFVIIVTLYKSANFTKGREHDLTIWILAMVFLFFSTSELSYPLWKYSPLYQITQWPWRWLLPVGLFAPLVLTRQLESSELSRWERLIGYLGLSLLGLFSVALLANLVDGDNRYDPTDHRQIQRRIHRLATSQDEVKRYLDQGGLSGECTRATLDCSMLEKSGQDRVWVVQTENEDTIRLPVYYHSNWELVVNGKTRNVRYDANTALIEVALSKGQNRIELIWGTSWATWVGRGISFIVMCILMYLAVSRKKHTAANLAP